MIKNNNNKLTRSGSSTDKASNSSAKASNLLKIKYTNNKALLILV